MMDADRRGPKAARRWRMQTRPPLANSHSGLWSALLRCEDEV